jgi:membrane dipeptidase
VAAQPERFVLANTIQDVERAAAQGKLAIGFDLEGAMPLLEQPDMVALYQSLGVRQMHLAYNRNNSVAGGCHDVEQGLTSLGHEVVQAINAAGVLMDCSHTGRRCSLDIMAHSQAPVIFSHANPLALVEHGRNITDEQIRACAATGGVVCISGVSKFLGTGNARPSAKDIARHAAYVADLVGVQHVGVGFDISFHQAGIEQEPPQGWDRAFWWPASAGYAPDKPSSYPAIEDWTLLPQALQDLGMTQAESLAVMGGNMTRVASQVWHS